jgi:hypothetical protein
MKETIIEEETRYAKSHHPVEDYALNIKMILMAMQQLGCGLADATIIGGLFLSICNNPLTGSWNLLLQEKLGNAQIDLVKDILDDNVEEEKKLSEKDDNGRSKLIMCLGRRQVEQPWFENKATPVIPDTI